MRRDRPPGIGELGPLGRAYLAGELRQATLRGEFRPSRREDVEALLSIPPGERQRFVARALQELRAGRVAFGVLAAGASTRMDLASMPESARRLLERSGRSQPKSKAMVPVVEIDGQVLSFLDLFLRNCRRLSEETASSCPVLLLLSDANASEIEAHLERCGRFGVPVVTFRQPLDRQIVATPQDLERARRNFSSAAEFDAALEISRRFAGHTVDVPKPAGHGEFLHQLVSSGTLVRLLDRGIRWISVRNIDNLGALLDENWLVILGRMIERAKRFTVEVSRRPDGPAGKGGALIVRPGGEFEIAEDPAFAGTGVDPRSSYYINNATAIFEVSYVYRIYETSEEELRSAPPERLAEIAERGRRKFPPLLDVKPVRLPDGSVIGAFVRETNLWESTGVVAGLGVDAIAVLSVKDIEGEFRGLLPTQQRERAGTVRFVATKKWEDYEGINALLAPYLARRVLEGPLVDPKLL